MASVDTGPWDGAQAMSDCATADDPAAAYAAICAGRREGDPSVQATWALPHHSHPGDPPNADGVRNSLSRLPQTQGLTNAEAAQRHLESHLEDIQAASDQGRSVLVPVEVEVRDLAKREMDMRLLPWDTEIDTLQGREKFTRGAFAGTDPGKVYLYSPNHEVRMGVGQDGKPVLTRVPIGKALSVEEKDDGPHATVRVAKTQAGDEALALAADGIASGVSIEFREKPGGTEVSRVDGRRIRIHRSVELTGLTTTHVPAYGQQASVLAVRTDHTEEGEPVATPNDQPVTETVPAPQAQPVDITPSLEQFRSSFEQVNSRVLDRLSQMEERYRQDIQFPTGQGKRDPNDPTIGDWVKFALRSMTGERVSDIEARQLSDLITTDNLGTIPTAYVQSELVGIIAPLRPFLSSTRQLNLPPSGMTLSVPVITTRPTTGVQATEKTDVTSTQTSITSATFDAVTIAGAGDISIQLLKRSDPNYLELYLQLLAEALALEADTQAVATLLDSGTTDGTGYIDPEDLLIGEAFTNAAGVSPLLLPDRMWMSTLAIQKFIDAKADTTNQPLYSDLAADITVANGARGFISGLRPVWVPALDGSGADVVIGPSRGFGWAEDGTYTLQVDVPSKAGRDVALVSMYFFATLYPAAFTTYRIAS